MELCEEHHDAIVYDSSDCPLCELINGRTELHDVVESAAQATHSMGIDLEDAISILNTVETPDWKNLEFLHRTLHDAVTLFTPTVTLWSSPEEFMLFYPKVRAFLDATAPSNATKGGVQTVLEALRDLSFGLNTLETELNNAPTE